MADIDFDKIQRVAASYIADWVESLPEPQRDVPVVRASLGAPALSPRAILMHVQEGTALGGTLIEHWVATTFADDVARLSSNRRSRIGGARHGAEVLSKVLPGYLLETVEKLDRINLLFVEKLKSHKAAIFRHSEIVNGIAEDYIREAREALGHLKDKITRHPAPVDRREKQAAEDVNPKAPERWKVPLPEDIVRPRTPVGRPG